MTVQYLAESPKPGGSVRPIRTHSRGLHFRVLGALELGTGSQQVPLRGTHPKAVLGFLLLNVNQVVATSRLIDALWPEDPPLTARKMLQNAVSRVRRALSVDTGEHPATILTYPSGYLLKVVPERVDLCRFRQLADVGRVQVSVGQWESASLTLREAFSLWRGAILVDLDGVSGTWPELDVLRNSRLAALEDYAEAELAMDNHQEVIARLETVLADPGQLTRERLSGQLMLALYRSGRQADALAVYRRTRSALLDRLGLDPSPEIQALERAILVHDETLTVSGSAVVVPAVWLPGRMLPVADRDGPVTPPAAGERKVITVMLILADIPHGDEDSDPEDERETRAALAETIQEVLRRFGGSVRTEVFGSSWSIQFGVVRTGERDAELAILAGLELRRRLSQLRLSGARAGRLVPRIALATGEALVVSRQGEDVEVTGGVFDTCLRLVSTAKPGQLRLCDATKELCTPAFRFVKGAGPGRDWQIGAAGEPEDARVMTSFVGRVHELQLLRARFRDTRLRRRAHLVTLLGEPGVGKSRLIAQFHDSFGSRESVRLLVARTPFFCTEPPHVAVLGQIRRSLGAEFTAPGNGEDAGTGELVELCAAAGPTVLTIEDVHLADDALVEFAEGLVRDAGSVPLLVVVTARPELLHRRPRSAGGSASATTITLDPLPEHDIRQLLSNLWKDQPPAGTCPEYLVDLAAGNPLFAQEYVAQLRMHGSRRPSGGVHGPAVPATLRRLIAARLDTLPARHKEVIQDAAVFGDVACSSAVAAVSESDQAEIAVVLEDLVHREFFRCIPHLLPDGELADAYEFRQVAVREVATAVQPRAVRAEKHGRVASWLEQRVASVNQQLIYHRRQAARLSGGRPVVNGRTEQQYGTAVPAGAEPVGRRYRRYG